MLGKLIKVFFGKELVLYTRHRQTIPLVKDPENRKRFVFLQIYYFWRVIPFRTSDKRKHRIMYPILNFIGPKYILEINWTSARDSLYKVWMANHPASKFIVVQHGSYVGGIVTDIAHRYTKCDIFLTWGDYFTQLFKQFNHGKKTRIISFGNPVYNNFLRDNLFYKEKSNGKILLLPSTLDDIRLKVYYDLIKRLEKLNFHVSLKQHNLQGKLNKIHNSFPFPQIKFENKIEGNLLEILIENDFDFIISDHSSALLDAIFFKNKVLYYDPSNVTNGTTTVYSLFLNNLFDHIAKVDHRDDLLKLININRQEQLLDYMITSGNNKLGLHLEKLPHMQQL
jgi:hypothetical protein